MDMGSIPRGGNTRTNLKLFTLESLTFTMTFPFAFILPVTFTFTFSFALTFKQLNSIASLHSFRSFWLEQFELFPSSTFTQFFRLRRICGLSKFSDWIQSVISAILCALIHHLLTISALRSSLQSPFTCAFKAFRTI